MRIIDILFVVALCCFGWISADDVWMVKDNGSPCLIATMNIKANFSFLNDSKTQNVLYEVPNNHTHVNTLSSKCDKEVSDLVVDWGNGNSFNIEFSNMNKSYELSTFKIALNISDIIIDAPANETVEIIFKKMSANDSSFETPANFSFHCNREQTLNSTDNSGFTIIISKVQFEAFKHDKTSKFSLAKDCESNFKPDIVPIAVGLSLIALIIIVLIAYIVGRRRQQARGYLNIM